MTKPVDLSIRFKLPKGHGAKHASITPDGELIIKDDDGNAIVPDTMERIVSYPRENKIPKIQSKSTASQSYLSISGLHELTKFDSVFVIDTNTKNIGNDKVSIACFACLTFKREEQSIRIVHEDKLNYYEFINIPNDINPEKLAIYKAVTDIESSIVSMRTPKIAFITDSDIESHEKINLGEIPIFRDKYLPKGYELHYASADTGSEPVHKIMKFCDREANHLFKALVSGEIKPSEYQFFNDEPTIRYRYHFRKDLEIMNPVVKGFSIPPGQKLNLYGIKDENT